MRFLQFLWYSAVLCLGLFIAAGNLIGPFRTGYFIRKFHYIFFALSVAIVFLVIPEARKAISKGAKDRQLAYKKASIVTWALALCIGLFGLAAYLMAGDKATFYGLQAAAFIVLFNFRPEK
jgi:hypothetical protein